VRLCSMLCEYQAKRLDRIIQLSRALERARGVQEWHGMLLLREEEAEGEQASDSREAGKGAVPALQINGGQLFSRQEVKIFSEEMREWVVASKDSGGGGVADVGKEGETLTADAADTFDRGVEEYKQVLMAAFLNRCLF